MLEIDGLRATDLRHSRRMSGPAKTRCRSMVDNTLLSIALPTIGRDLGGVTTALQWVTGAYSLTFGGCC
jgi:MFS family permease